MKLTPESPRQKLGLNSNSQDYPNATRLTKVCYALLSHFANEAWGPIYSFPSEGGIYTRSRSVLEVEAVKSGIGGRPGGQGAGRAAGPVLGSTAFLHPTVHVAFPSRLRGGLVVTFVLLYSPLDSPCVSSLALG